MMMISNNRRRSRGTFFLWALLLIVAVIVAAIWRAELNTLVWQALSPLSAARDALGNSHATQLEVELASTTAALADRDALYQENLELKAMLGRDASVPQIFAGVLERPPQTPYDTLTVDAGSQDGVVAGDWVAASGGAIIGSVGQVEAHTAQVQLLSAPGAQYQGVLGAAGTDVPVAITGEGGGSLTAQVPSGTQVAVGDQILIPGIATGIEATVSATSGALGQSFITLYLQLPADPTELQYVEIWKEQSAQ